MKRNDLIYPEWCYKIVGILYDVDNQIGAGHKEKLYQKAIAISFTKQKIQFQEQVYCPLMFDGKTIGKYYLDFLVNDIIVLEIKKGSILRKKDIDQVYSYLRAKNLKLGIVANFTKSGVRYKRIVNIR